MIRGLSRVGGQLVLVSVLVALVAGSVLGQPILLSFVETGSMEPTINTGDGFIAIPAAVSGEVSTGDVIVFDAQEIEGGGLTTHRVVEETEQGYVTRGDANPFTDQDGGEPHVQDGQIVATALQINGYVVPIPHLGTAVMGLTSGLETIQTQLAIFFGTRSLLGTTGLAYIFLALSLVAYAYETRRENQETARTSRFGRKEEWNPDPRLLSVAFAAIIVIAAAGAMLAPAGTQSFDVISADFESEQPLVIESGTTEAVPYIVGNGGYLPIVTYVEPASDGVAVEPQEAAVGGQDEQELTLSLTAPSETGYYPMYTREYRYLHVLPRPVIGALYSIHPWIPTVTILGVLGGGMYGLSRLALGSGDVRARRKRARARRSQSTSRLWRLFK